MAKILLGVTGSVAAMHTPLLFRDLKQTGHDVKIVATNASLYFFDPAEIEPIQVGSAPARNPEVVVLDEDEWPGRETPSGGRGYQRGDKVLHIELRRWADLLLIAPLDANTLAKLACGLADNCLTCVWRAWDRTRPVILAPAMNTLMWEHPFTHRHLQSLADSAVPEKSPTWTLDEMVDSARLSQLDAQIDWINKYCPRLRIVAPISKRLACDDVGVGALAEREQILAAVRHGLA